MVSHLQGALGLRARSAEEEEEEQEQEQAALPFGVRTGGALPQKNASAF
jgi:hypothetical protein